MSAQRKQYADLIRHRELNALRRLMVGKQTPGPTAKTTLAPSQHLAVHSLSHINALEEQMNQQLFDRSAQTSLGVFSTRGGSTLVSASTSAFAPTQILAIKPSPATSPQHSQHPHHPQPTAQSIPAPEQAVLTQAAALFASHDLRATQALLSNALSAQGAQRDHVPTWLALFDFYRATDQAQLFDSMALDFSVRFGRSTPSWVSIPALAATAPAPAPAPISNPSMPHCDWVAPPYLEEGALAGLDVLLQQATLQKRTLRLDWRSLVDIAPLQWPAVKHHLNAIAAQPLHCVMYGLPSLTNTFTKTLSESMLAQLALLRCQNQMTSFETLALDYCVIFEVSPPDWLPPQCQLEAQDDPLTSSPIHLTPPSTLPTSSPSEFELVGEVELLPSALLQSITTTERSSERHVIRCDRLVRIAPKPMRDLRLWVQTLGAKGIRIEFKDVHRLIAAYFLDQGLYELAKVSIRKD